MVVAMVSLILGTKLWAGTTDVSRVGGGWLYYYLFLSKDELIMQE